MNNYREYRRKQFSKFDGDDDVIIVMIVQTVSGCNIKNFSCVVWANDYRDYSSLVIVLSICRTQYAL